MSWVAEPEAIASAYRPIAAALGVDARMSEPALRAALREAEHLADDTYDVPGALLFAFGRNPRCFSAFRAMSLLVVEWHTKALGFRLEATRPELARMLARVAVREAAYDEVRSWVAERLIPFGG